MLMVLRNSRIRKKVKIPLRRQQNRVAKQRVGSFLRAQWQTTLGLKNKREACFKSQVLRKKVINLQTVKEIWRLWVLVIIRGKVIVITLVWKVSHIKLWRRDSFSKMKKFSTRSSKAKALLSQQEIWNQASLATNWAWISHKLCKKYHHRRLNRN